MDEMTQQNAALVEQAAATAESMQTQSTALAQAVAGFKLQQGSHGGMMQAAVVPQPVGVVKKQATPLPARKPAVKTAGASGGGMLQAAGKKKQALPAGSEDDWEEF